MNHERNDKVLNYGGVIKVEFVSCCFMICIVLFIIIFHLLIFVLSMTTFILRVWDVAFESVMFHVKTHRLTPVKEHLSVIHSHYIPINTVSCKDTQILEDTAYSVLHR